jgi:hypothetical protein
MNRCVDCRHWNRDGEAPRLTRESGTHGDTFIKEPSAHRRCEAIEHGNPYGSAHDPLPDAPHRLALVTDEENFDADLWTLPDFGCTLWLPREETPDAEAKKDA